MLLFFRMPTDLQPPRLQDVLASCLTIAAQELTDPSAPNVAGLEQCSTGRRLGLCVTGSAGGAPCLLVGVVTIVVAVVILNELFDRKVAGDKNGHPGGDVLVAIVVVVIVAVVWDFVAVRRSRQLS